MYSDYLKERAGLETLELERGFATYKFRGLDCYIQDIYVKPEYRKEGIASILADKIAVIAKHSGINILTGSVDARAETAEASDAVLRAYGMKPYVTDEYVTYYSKEII